MKHFYFLFYPKDFISGTMAMKAEEVGAYIRLLCYQFENDSLPMDDMEALETIAGTKNLKKVLAKFPDGINIKLKTVKEEGKRISEARKESAKAKQNASKTSAKPLQKPSKTSAKAKQNLCKTPDSDSDTDLYSDTITNKDKYNQEATSGAVAPAATTPQAAFMLIWKAMYTSCTGDQYKDDKKDYVLIASLMKRFGPEKVAEKAKLLFETCMSGKDRFFSRDKLTIGILSSCWNSIIVKKDANQLFYEDIQRQKEMEKSNAA